MVAMNRKRNLYIKRAKKSADLLKCVPFIRMVALNGSMARGEDTEKSDIDFLIVAKAGRLYTARFFATAIVGLTGWRRHGDKIAGRVCLNCYLNDISPDIAPRDKRSMKKVAFSNKFMVVLLDYKNTSLRFIKQNDWIQRYKVEGGEYSKKLTKKLAPYGARHPLRLFEPMLSTWFGDVLEKKLMDYQVRRIMAGRESGDETVATAEEIRLHPQKNKKY